MDLPIDVIPGTNPPKFRWRQNISTPIGPRVTVQEGTLPASVEQSVLALIVLVRQQNEEIKNLQRLNSGHVDRIAAQSEVITKKAESPQPKKGKV